MPQSQLKIRSVPSIYSVAWCPNVELLNKGLVFLWFWESWFCLFLTCLNWLWFSWRAFSIQKAIVKEKESGEKADLPVASPLDTASKPHWLDDLDGDDDDDDEDFDFESLAKALAEAATTVASSNSKKPKSKPGGFNVSSGTKAAKPSSPFKSETDQIKVETGAVVPCFYIYTKEEKVSKEVDRVSMSYASMSIKDKESSKSDESETEEAWEDEKYEHDKALNADRTYLKFKKRIDADPEQCFR